MEREQSKPPSKWMKSGPISRTQKMHRTWVQKIFQWPVRPESFTKKVRQDHSLRNYSAQTRFHRHRLPSPSAHLRFPSVKTLLPLAGGARRKAKTTLALAGLNNALLLETAGLAGLAPSLQDGFLSAPCGLILGPCWRGSGHPGELLREVIAEIKGARSSAQAHSKTLLMSYQQPICQNKSHDQVWGHRWGSTLGLFGGGTKKLHNKSIDIERDQ